MDKKIIIKYREEPAWDVIGGGITAYNTEKAGDDHGKHLCFVLEDSDGEILGGVIGMTYWNWLRMRVGSVVLNTHTWIPLVFRHQVFTKSLVTVNLEG